MSDSMTAGRKTSADIANLLKARNTLLWVISPEEKRAESGIYNAALEAKYEVRLWDCVSGVSNVLGEDINISGGNGRTITDPVSACAAILNDKTRAVWILRDVAHRWLDDPSVRRALRNLSRALLPVPNKEARTVVILTPSSEVPPELRDHTAVVEWPMPDRTEIGDVLDSAVEDFPEFREQLEKDGCRDQAIEAALGLTAETAAGCYTKSLVTYKKIVPAAIAAEKKRVISQSKGIEWHDPDPRGLDAIGGLALLKRWLISRKAGFTQEARDFGLRPPKGILLVGVPGAGKSLTAKATASAFECPLLRLDMGAAQSKWVGESQANIRAALQLAELLGKSVLWIDEIEKALAGATQGAADGGVSADALGTLLSWMQERKGSVFVIATANDVSKLPPELLRKGRWDDMFFVDLPTASERRDIIAVAMRKYGRDPKTIDAAKVAEVTAEFTGAEIDALVEPALYAAFADQKRDVTTDDLVKAAGETVPLARTAKEKIEALREWAKSGRARPASLPEERRPVQTSGRKLDI